jgi:DNA ligase (NAD+)
MEKMGEKSARNLLDALNRTKSNDLSRLLFAFGIRQGGQRSSKILARQFRNLETIMGLTVEEMASVHEIGEKTARSVADYFSLPHNIEIIRKLAAAGVNTSYIEEAGGSDLLAGKKFVITGTIEGITRSALTKLIEQNGGGVSGSVSAKTDYVLAGDEAGSKLDKAVKLGVPVIDYDGLKAML